MKTSINKSDYKVEYEIEHNTHILTCYRDNSTETIFCQCNFSVPIFDVELNGLCYKCGIKSTGFLCRSCARSNSELNRFRKQAMSYVTRGYKSVSADPNIKAQKKQTMINKYGVENPSQLEDVKKKLSETAKQNSATRLKKAKTTIQNRYGVDHYSQTDDYKKKYQKTSKEKYGVDHILQSSDVRSKQKQTMIDKYGVENPSQHQSFLEKRNTTNLEKYGNICSAQDEKIQEKIKTDLKNIHGVESWFQVPEVVEKITIQRQINKYGDLLESFREDWRKVYFDQGINAALIAFPNIKAKTAMDNFLKPDERKCVNGRSHLEGYIKNYFEKKGLNFEQNVRSIVPGHNRWEIDLINKEHKISIEVNGVYWHQIHSDKTDRDKSKAQLMRSIGYKHLSLDETDLQKLGVLYDIVNPFKKSIGARKCKIVFVDSKRERLFLEKNHLDGYVSSEICYGLEYNGDLLQLMSFGKDRWSRKSRIELLRLCTSQEYIVVGGAKRLFKHAMKSINKEIVSYSNNKYFSGEINNHLGFAFDGNTNPGYKWMKNSVTLSRYQTQKHKLGSLLREKFDENQTEDYNMQKAGWHKIKDFGNARWIYKP